MFREANVLSRRNRPTTKSYRAAVKRIVLNLQAQHDLTDGELAERLGCSAGTVKNARNEAGNLDGVTLLNAEYEFGSGAIDPVMELGGSRAVPKGAHCDSDFNPALPLSQALTAIIATQHENSPGGPRTLSEEVAPIMQQLREARATLDRLILMGERA
ncbi:hypothetical protein, partial [Sphingobium sp. DC-2]|uniref:hypothetical protein n=1 Tax=Sphingobium sp. DC-2 TaxID=1303256 RepID=UPI0004C3487B